MRLLPFAIRAATARATLTRGSLRTWNTSNACVETSVQYGSRDRNLVDVYHPAGANESAAGLPVVLFVHGGVWSSGELWHYSAMGSDLASQGCVVVVATYQLYPQEFVPQQVRDVEAALRWTEVNCHRYGGDPRKINLVGHSSGAHLSLMTVLARAGLHKDDDKPAEEAAGTMPKNVILMAGVYDITKHYEYERFRGVHSLSAMARANQGPENFERFSPAILLSEEAGRASPSSSSEDVQEGIRKGIEVYEKERAELRQRGDLPSFLSKPVAGPREASDHFPGVHLLSGLSDDVVPWYWSNELATKLERKGISFSNQVYAGASHLDFIACWGRGENLREHLKNIRSDVLEIVKRS